MLHPFMTEELAHQRRAALNAESRNERLARQVQAPARADPESRRFVLMARMFARHVRAVVARAS
jgi:hypothetical protein